MGIWDSQGDGWTWVQNIEALIGLAVLAGGAALALYKWRKGPGEDAPVTTTDIEKLKRDILAQLAAKERAGEGAAATGAGPGGDGLAKDLSAAIGTLAKAGKTQALELLEQGDRSAADAALAAKIAELEAARGKAASGEAALYRQRGALAFLSDTAEAMRHYAKAAELDPDDPDGWNNLGHLQDRVGALDAAIASYGKVLALGNSVADKAVIAAATGNLGNVYETRGNLARAEEMYRKALALYEELGRKQGMAVAFGNLGNVYLTRGHLAQAETMYRKALALDEELGDKEGMANQYGNLGIVYLTHGDLARAEEMYRKALAIDEELGAKEGMANQYGNLGNAYLTLRDLAHAEEMYGKALTLNEELGRKEGIAIQYGNLGIVYSLRGDLRAEETCRKALALDEKLGSKEGMASGYGRLGILYQEKGDMTAARAHWRKARGMWREIGNAGEVEKYEGWLREAGCPGG
jgi:protein O-GlcNAc transferase